MINSNYIYMNMNMKKLNLFTITLSIAIVLSVVLVLKNWLENEEIHSVGMGGVVILSLLLFMVLRRNRT